MVLKSFVLEGNKVQSVLFRLGISTRVRCPQTQRLWQFPLFLLWWWYGKNLSIE